MRKTAATLIIMAAALPLSTAIDVNPGIEFNITSNTSNLVEQESDLSVQFNQRESILYGNLPQGFPSQTGEIILTYQNQSNTSQTFSKTIPVNVTQYSNWTVENQETPSELSMGETGRLTILNVTQRGNQQKQIQVNATGNLTEYISFPNQFRIYPQNTIRQTLTYSIPENIESGEYRSKLNLTQADGDLSRVLNITTQINDDIPPKINSVSFPDVMSTQRVNFTANISDNQNVSNVEAEILKEATIQENDGTDLINESFTNLDFEYDGSKYGTPFFQTSEIGQYYYRLFANDTSGNTVEKRGSFQVNGLDSVDILANNFDMDAVYPSDASGDVIEDKQSEARKNIFRIDQETSVNIKLDNFQHTVPNSTITVGIQAPGQSVPDNFDLGSDNPSLSFEDPGEYRIVVESDSAESFSGELNVTLVPQHVGDRHREINFEGLVSNPQYPPEQSWTVRGFNASLEYLNTDASGQPDKLRRVLVAPADVCRGFSSAESCPQINDFEEIVAEVKQENSNLESQNGFLKLQRNVSVILTVLILVGYVRSKNLAGKHVAVNPVKQ